ncbi:insulin-like growth factor-binding protein complex acid labile subunit, partial [Ctenocephalides felis]
INANQLTTLDDEMPSNGNKLILVHAANNRLTHLPQSFKGSQHLESLFFQHNLITGFNGALQRCRKLKRLQFSHNNIRELFDDDFFETENLEDLQLGYNELTSLNGSLLPLKLLRTLNLTHNLLKDFSVQELRGLRRLRVVDLSHNRVERITGRMENLVESETRIVELRLDHNRLTSLDGALMGVQGLVRLSVAHNLIERISPGDLIGLDVLRVLDVSHNRLTALEETAKTFLPALDELFASHNRIRALHQDFHGLPSLCWADLSHNEIEILSPELVRHTRCSIHGAPLKIYLQDNPVLCDDRWPETMTAIEGQQARVYGSTQCVGMAIVNNANSPLSIGGPDIVDSIIAEDGTIIGGQNVNAHKMNPVETPKPLPAKIDTFDEKSTSLQTDAKNAIGGSILQGSGLNLNDNRVPGNQSGGSGLDNGVHKLHIDAQKITSDQTLTVLTLNDEKTPIVVAPPMLLQPAVENLAVDNTSSDEI